MQSNERSDLLIVARNKVHFALPSTLVPHFGFTQNLPAAESVVLEKVDATTLCFCVALLCNDKCVSNDSTSMAEECAFAYWDTDPVCSLRQLTFLQCEQVLRLYQEHLIRVAQCVSRDNLLQFYGIRNYTAGGESAKNDPCSKTVCDLDFAWLSALSMAT